MTNDPKMGVVSVRWPIFLFWSPSYLWSGWS